MSSAPPGPSAFAQKGDQQRVGNIVCAIDVGLTSEVTAPRDHAARTQLRVDLRGAYIRT